MVARARLPALLAWAIAAIGIVIVVFGLLLWAGRGFGALPVSFGRGVLGVVGLVVSPLTYITFGALLSARIPRNPVGWLLLACGFLLATMLPINLFVASSHEIFRQPDDSTVLLAWLRTTLATPVVAALLVTAVFLFPDGHLISRRWSTGIVAAVAAAALLALGAALNTEGLVTYPTIRNPTALSREWAPLVNAIQTAGVTLMLIAIVHAVVAIGARYRAGDRVGRAQLRWILFATMISAAAAIPFFLTRYLVDVGPTLGELSALAIQLGICAFPMAAAAAISHYRLYEVDLLIGRTLVFVPLMAILSGMYTASIALIQRLFVSVTGQTSDVAIVITLLLVASTFTPLRRALETTLERRFPAMSPVAAAAIGDGAAIASDASAAVPPAGAPAGSADTLPLARLSPIEDDNHVDCALYGRVGVSRCLTCRYLTAITRSPLRAVVCAGGATVE